MMSGFVFISFSQAFYSDVIATLFEGDTTWKAFSSSKIMSSTRIGIKVK